DTLWSPLLDPLCSFLSHHLQSPSKQHPLTPVNKLPVHIPKQSITLCEKKAQALQSPSHWLRQEISPIISANPPPIQ
uniref:Uncharacterized protein n=1 Tax=Melopsittacus undulatus TaxID=13146 RepID=A0A8C6J2J5_MELUD